MKALVLIGSSLTCWIAAAGVAVLIDGPGHWLPSGVAVLLCLLPALGTLLLAGWSERKTAVAALGFILIAPLVRLFLVLAVGGLLGFAVPSLRADPARFAFWTAGMYLVTLVAETAVLLAGTKPKGGATGANTPTTPTDS